MLRDLVRPTWIRAIFMAGNETTPPADGDSTANHVSHNVPSEKSASFAKALEGLANMDLSEMLKLPKGTVETAADGSMTLKLPSGEEIKGLGPEAFWGGSFMPSCEAEEVLPPTSDNGEDDMGLLDKFRICLCSEVTGVITQDGKPVAGAEVIRRLDLFLPKDQVYTDSTVTDAGGRFDFKPRYAKHWKPLMAEVRTDQKLLVRHAGKQYLGWANVACALDLHQDVFVPGIQEGCYVRLNFNGDLARATPLSENDDLDQLMEGKGFFNSQVVCIATRLRFFVTMNGEKAVGAKVVRTAEHVGYDKYEQSRVSDLDGEVADMPALYAPQLIHSWANTEIRQKVVITYEGKEYLAWEKTKTNPWEEGEHNPDDKKWGFYAEITAELSDDQNMVRGVKTDPDRCWKGEQGADYLPDDALPYKGLFQVTRYSPNIKKGRVS